MSSVVAGADDVDALGSCTGNAGTAAVSLLLDDTEAKAAGMDLASAKASEEWAIGLYAQATGLDDADGAFPPADTGSSGLGIAKALERRGLVGHYRHATTATAVAALLQSGAVLFGTPWFKAWFEPESTVVRFRNSWSRSWGDDGDGLMTLATYQVLRRYIDAIQLRK